MSPLSGCGLVGAVVQYLPIWGCGFESRLGWILAAALAALLSVGR